MATRSGRVGLQNNKSNAKATPLSQPVADKAVTPKTPKEAPVVKLVETVDDNVEDPEPCNGCKAVITESECDKTIKCDQCQKWYHLKCSSLNTRALTFLKTADDLYPGIKWFCNYCLDTTFTSTKTSDDRYAQQDAKIDRLVELYSNMQEKMETVLDKLGNDKIEKQISVGVTEGLTDQQEVNEKKNNMMVFNLSESTGDDKSLDLTKVKELLTFVNPDIDTDSLSCENVTRMGFKKPANDDHKPRPIKIVFDDPDTKWQFIKNAKKLSGSESFKKVGLSLDKTTKERQEDEKLRKELEAERKIRPTEDLIIFRKRIIPRANRQAEARKLRQAGLEAADAASGSC